MRLSEARIDALIAEDIPYFDLTCEVLGVKKQPGRMTFYTREDCVLSGAGVAARIGKRLGLEVPFKRSCGERLTAGEEFLVMEGEAQQLHMAWKVSLNALDHMSAIATKTRRMVDAVHAVNPHCEILTTRKSMPGVKDLQVAACMAGGAYPHRMGLSETVLVFDHHLTFIGGMDALIEQLPQIKARCCEKKIFVECGAADAERLVRAGVGGIQFDKVPVAEMPQLVARMRALEPAVTLIAAGGINETNAAAYAATGVDGIATTAPFTAKPIDMSVRMELL
ncbi:MAG: ModD protein [Coriobacteriales bacterium]|nr:ModD protein [Coriobacteriales bacterium]